MARVRRKASSGTRLNLEIVGITAIALSVGLGIALAMPRHSGIAGIWTAHALGQLFGGAAPLFPVLIALFGVIVFLEINVPRMIATLGVSALCYFLLIDAAFGSAGMTRGGFFGGNIWSGFHSLVGSAGAWIVLVIATLALTLWLTNASLKKVIGLILGAVSQVRVPKIELPQGHTSVREAFALPAKIREEKQRVYDDEETSAVIVSRDADASRVERRGTDEIDGDEVSHAIVPIEAFVPHVAPPMITIEADDVEQELLDDSEDYRGPSTSPVPSVALERDSRGARDDVPYRLPDLTLFDPPQAQVTTDSNRAHVLEDTLASFGVGAKVTHIEHGPAITRYELKPDRGVKISRIAALSDDLALALAAASIRIEAPIPGKSAVGIEVPNKTVSIVAIREILEAIPQRGQVPPLWMALGKDITGRPVFGDLGKMPHLLVAGATGAGKSVCLNCILATLLASATPDQVQLLMIDPKRVELTVYNGIPHLIKEVITDPRLAAGALFEMTKEMDSRYERFAKAGVRKIEEYNAKFPEETLPYVVIVIDELADLMLVAPQRVETTIMRLAQLARATGIHLIVATQRPSVDVITGLIKANVPSRISFAVSSQVDSRTILDMAGAERLLGRGDMLYLPIDAPKPIRAQGALITGSEVNRLVDFWAKQARPDNLLDVEVTPISEDDGDKREVDPLCYDAARFIIESQYASTAQLQSQFSIGHPRAVRLMKQLEEFKVVGPHEGTKPRRILLGLADLEQISSRLGKRDDAQQDLFANG